MSNTHHSSLFSLHSSLFTLHSSLFTLHSSLFTTGWCQPKKRNFLADFPEFLAEPEFRLTSASEPGRGCTIVRTHTGIINRNITAYIDQSTVSSLTNIPIIKVPPLKLLLLDSTNLTMVSLMVAFIFIEMRSLVQKLSISRDRPRIGSCFRLELIIHDSY